MKRMTVKEILDTPELAQYIAPENCHFFVPKKSDLERIQQQIAEKINAATNKLINDPKFMEKYVGANSDALMTWMSIKATKEVLKENAKSISADRLALFTGLQASSILFDTTKLEEDKNTRHNEIYFEDGEYLVVDGNQIDGVVNGYKIQSREELNQFQEKLAIGLIKSANQFDLKRKNNATLSGPYLRTGQNSGTERISGLDANKLWELAMARQTIGALTPKTTVKLIKEGYLNKNDMLKFLSNRYPETEELIFDLMENGIATEDEIVRRVYRKKSFIEVAKDEKTPQNMIALLYASKKIPLKTLRETVSFNTALMLYAYDELPVEELEKMAKSVTPEDKNITDFIPIMSVAYQEKTSDEKITGISALLTHNILDYEKSMELLDGLAKEQIISEDERTYIEGIMSDFKTNELLNDTENEILDVSGNSERVQHHVPRLTIDPEVRMEYFKSLGAVKKVKIKGENFIADSEENRGKRNSMDGYELFILPAKKVAILEKLYETTRDKDGNIVYRKNKQGELIPAVENATYMMPIEMAKEFAETKNKRELIQSPYVERTYHTLDWVANTERKLRKIRPEIQIDRDETKKWSDIIKENYEKNKNAMTIQ